MKNLLNYLYVAIIFLFIGANTPSAEYTNLGPVAPESGLDW